VHSYLKAQGEGKRFTRSVEGVNSERDRLEAGKHTAEEHNR
jgi:hypothetical protein